MDRKSVDILLIEDNADHVELIIKALRNNNVLNEVHVVTSGEAAMDFLYQKNFDFICDCHGFLLFFLYDRRWMIASLGRRTTFVLRYLQKVSAFRSIVISIANTCSYFSSSL